MADHLDSDQPFVLVTGGAGYVGSHACKALAQAGFRPVVYDTLARGHRWAVKWGPLEVGDILDEGRLRDVLRAYRPIGVIHFAALIEVRESLADPLAFYQNNVGGTISLLRAMRAEGVNRIVFSSTCATYGTPSSNPIHENSPQDPINPYGQSKLMVERILQDCARDEAFSAIALRYFNASGADADGDIGEAHFPETHLIPLALSAAKGGGEGLTVFGSDHPTPDGTCVRDYVHVTDLADAHVKALERTGKHRGFEAFNLGTGQGVSIKALLDRVRPMVQRDVPHTYGPRREGDPAALVADASNAEQILGWRPRHSDIDNILKTAWAWISRQ